ALWSSRVRGRWNSRMRLVQLRSTGGDESFNAPYLGRSKRNHPIVLSEHGPFEIVSGLDLWREPTVVVIDATRERVLAKFYGVEFPVIRETAVGIAAFVKSGNDCVTAPTRTPGLLSLD